MKGFPGRGYFIKARRQPFIEVEVTSESSEIERASSPSFLSNTFIDALTEQENHHSNSCGQEDLQPLRRQVARLQEERRKDARALQQNEQVFRSMEQQVMQVESKLKELMQENRNLKAAQRSKTPTKDAREVSSLQVRLSTLESAYDLVKTENQTLKKQLEQKRLLLEQAPLQPQKNKEYQFYIKEIREELVAERTAKRLLGQEVDRLARCHKEEGNSLRLALEKAKSELDQARAEVARLQRENIRCVSAEEEQELRRTLVEQEQRLKEFDLLKVSYESTLSTVRMMEARLQQCAKESVVHAQLNQDEHDGQERSLRAVLIALTGESQLKESLFSKEREEFHREKQRWQMAMTESALLWQGRLREQEARNESRREEEIRAMTQLHVREKEGLQTKNRELRQMFQNSKEAFEQNAKLIRSERDHLLQIDRLKKSLSEAERRNYEVMHDRDITRLRLAELERALSREEVLRAEAEEEFARRQSELLQASEAESQSNQQKEALMRRELDSVSCQKSALELKCSQLLAAQGALSKSETNLRTSCEEFRQRVESLQSKVLIAEFQLASCEKQKTQAEKTAARQKADLELCRETVVRLQQEFESERLAAESNRAMWQGRETELMRLLERERREQAELRKEFALRTEQLGAIGDEMRAFIQGAEQW